MQRPHKHSWAPAREFWANPLCMHDHMESDLSIKSFWTNPKCGGARTRKFEMCSRTWRRCNANIGWHLKKTITLGDSLTHTSRWGMFKINWTNVTEIIYFVKLIIRSKTQTAITLQKTSALMLDKSLTKTLPQNHLLVQTKLSKAKKS